MNRRNILLYAIGAIALAGLALWFLWLSPRRDQGRVPSELTFRIDSFAINLYPPTLAEINSRRIGTLLHAPLVRIREDGSLTPAIASSWSDEGLVWRFRIRPDARFSDGRPITAADASASLCRAMQPGSSWAWSLKSIAQTGQGEKVRCDGLTVEGDQLVVRQTVDAPWLEQAIAGPAGWILPADASAGAAYGTVPGAGRYKVESIVPDSHVLLAPVDRNSGTPPIRFRYVADDNQAAALMRQNSLSSLYLQSPLLKSAVPAASDSYRLTSRRFDRVRVLIINRSRLARLGFGPREIATFRDAFDTTIDRERIQRVSNGIAVADSRPLPIFGKLQRSRPDTAAVAALPRASLTVLSEPDSFSDQIAAALPARVGPVEFRQRPIEKGALIGALVADDFDIVCLVLEGTMHSPKFWSSFFEPQGAFVAFGTPVAGVEKIDFTAPDAVRTLDTLLTRDSNWIVLFRENRIDAISNSLAGMAYTPSGQDDLSSAMLRPAR